MEKFAAAEFYFLLKHLTEMKNSVDLNIVQGKTRSFYSLDGVKSLSESIANSCERLGLRASMRAAVHLNCTVKEKETDLQKLRECMQNVEAVIDWEMQDALFFHVTQSSAVFYNQQEPFGESVSIKFPHAQFDMVEAGNCYALGRGTACVFHLMRVMEIGVQHFGDKLGVTLVSEKNWQNILDELNKALKNLLPKCADTILMSQASANLYAVKLAWRNEVMHPKETYTLEEAENILRQVKIFMGNIAELA